VRAFVENAIVTFAAFAAALFILALVVLLLHGCAPSVYGAKMEACRELSGSCEAYVSCRKRVAAEQGRAFEATCDGGAP